MHATELHIKNMVSNRCKIILRLELEKIGITFKNLQLGSVQILKILSTKQHDALKIALHNSGLEIIEDRKAILVEKIKNVIVEMIHYDNNLPKSNFSEYLSTKLGYDYTYLSNLFSGCVGTTIEHFIILNKIERVKELILYDEHTLTEITDLLHYSSISHLSNQFKNITGISPSMFKKLKNKSLNNLESL